MKFLSKEFTNSTVESVKDIIGNDYSQMEKFFWDKFFAFEESICTILITRRCFLLAIWFLSCFVNDKKVQYFELTQKNSCVCIRKKGTDLYNFILSDKGLPLLQNLSNIKKIVVLDDICIHGRQIERIRLSVSDRFEIASENVAKEVFLSSEESMVKAVDACKESRNGYWLLLSQRIVEAINYLLLPYVSYINSFVSYDISAEEVKKFLAAIESDERLMMIPFGRDNRQHLGKLSFYIIENNSFNNQEKDLKCIRFYYNLRTHVASFIPSVILAPIKNKFCKENFGDYLAKYLRGEAVTKVLTEIDRLLGDDYNRSKDYLYNLLSCIASQHYAVQFALEFLEKKDDKSNRFDFINNSSWQPDVCRCLDMAFGSAITFVIQNCQNYILDEIYQVERAAEGDLVDLSMVVDDFTRDRWADREQAAVNGTAEPPKVGLFQLINDIALTKKGDWDKGHSKHFRKIIAYSYLYSVVNECDNGRQNLANQSNRAESFLEVGELGALTARKFVREAKSQTLDRLLHIPYYHYILR